MIKVYFETSSYCTMVAVFDNEETYYACLPSLEKLAEKDGYFITESLEESDINDLN
jgi:hypothetical protein